MIVDTVHEIANARARGPDAVVGIMARIMADHRSMAGAVTEDDLLAAGFTRLEVAAHSARARERAASRQIYEDDRDRDTAQAAITAEAANFAKLVVRMEDTLRAFKAGTERLAGRVG